MSKEETVTELEAIRSVHKICLMVSPRDSISAGVTASKGENEDELERNPVRERLFLFFLFFKMGKG
jgi:hypothetical protein